jgi:hypothetical protein
VARTSSSAISAIGASGSRPDLCLASVCWVLSRAAILLYFFVPLVMGPALVPAATAQTPDDPPAGSPPVAVYRIPLEGGRTDAAPRNRKTAPVSGGSGSGGSASGSLYRSENNFGSSSQVPGGISDPSPSDEGETSVPAAVSLLALIAVAGVGTGVIAVRSARRGS